MRDFAAQHGALIRPGTLREIARGGEHTVHDAGGEWVLKLTHPGGFGLFVEVETEEKLRACGATPAQYLERVILTRDIFGDDWRFIGVVLDGEDLSAATLQPFIRGDAPSYEEICALFGDFGFHEIEAGHFFRASDRVGVIDAWPRNFVKLGEDVLPIDIVPLHARGALLAYQAKRCAG